MNAERMPRTLAKLNAQLDARHRAGLSIEHETSAEVIYTDRRGTLLRLVFVFDDGECITIDTNECARFLAYADACLLLEQHDASALH